MISGNANWDKIWSKKISFGNLVDWEAEIFSAIYLLLKDVENAKILSAGCGRGVIDYWLLSVLGYSTTLLDYSKNCVKHLRKAFEKFSKDQCEIQCASILEMPYPDNSFDLVWNEGVLEHFSPADFERAFKEMARVSRKFVLIDVPYSKSRPYMLSKKWLEENNLWSWGYEEPKPSLRELFEAEGVSVIQERPIGSSRTNQNYVNLIPSAHRENILNQLTVDDFKIPPHLMTIGEKK